MWSRFSLLPATFENLVWTGTPVECQALIPTTWIFPFLPIQWRHKAASSVRFDIWNSFKACKFSRANVASGKTAIGQYFRANKWGSEGLVHRPVYLPNQYQHFQQCHGAANCRWNDKNFAFLGIFGQHCVANVFIQSEQKLLEKLGSTEIHSVMDPAQVKWFIGWVDPWW